MKKISIPTSFQSNKYPAFMRQSIFLRAYPKPEKVFPRIGLANCSMKLSALKLDKQDMLHAYMDQVLYQLEGISSYSVENKYASDITAIKRMAEKCHVDIADNDKSKYLKSITKGKSSIIKISKKVEPTLKHLKLNEDKDLTDLVAQVANISPSYIKKPLTSIKLKTKPSLSSDLEICFSSDGNQGSWDIATMSMRGVSSCMRWDFC